MRLIALLSLVLFAAACGPTMPDRIHPELLEKPSDELADRLEMVEREIILIPDQKEKLGEKMLATKVTLKAAEKALAQATEEQKSLKAALSEANKAKDQAKIDQLTQELAQKDQEVAQRAAIRDYQAEAQKTQQAKLDLLNAQLSAKVAEQMLVQAQIAQEFQATEEGQAMKGHEPINPEPFQKYLEAVQKKLAEQVKKTGEQAAHFESLTQPEPVAAPTTEAPAATQASPMEEPAPEAATQAASMEEPAPEAATPATP
ncbi:MAG: hypothetical protein RRB13_16420 [bacterium]|nr:hypothetical protein [bacterium]